MVRKIFQRILPFTSLVLFGLALWFLHHLLRNYHYSDILHQLSDIPGKAIGLAILFTLMSYVALVGYDLLAFRYIRKNLDLGKKSLTSFISYAFSNTIGHSLITGGSVRYRLYSLWGISGEDISKVVAFSAITFWMGVLTLGGLLFVAEPISLPIPLAIHHVSSRVFGCASLILLVAYFYLVIAKRKGSIVLFGWVWDIPSLPLVFGQMIVSSVDWIFSAAVLFVLLPPSSNLPFISYLGIYLLGTMLALISHVPAGLGVFESIVVLMLSPIYPASAILSALLGYRLFYSIVPLGVASGLFGLFEIFQGREWIKKWFSFWGNVVPRVAPPLFSFAVFLAGAILLFSGATPAVPARLHLLVNFLPLPIIEVSHFVGSLVGVGLLVLAIGLQRRLDAAYHLTAVLLGVGIAASLLKGFDFEEAIILSLMLGMLWSCRGFFYRQAVLWKESFTPGWIAAIVIVLAGSIWLGIFAHKHLDYSADLWWKFSLRGDAPRFLRASVGAIALLVVLMGSKLLQTAHPEPARPTPQDLEAVKGIVFEYPETSSQIALLGDKTLLFNENKTAFIMYGVQGRSWVSMGDPVGPDKEKGELIWQFREMADEHQGWPVFYEVGRANLSMYVDLGLALLKLGEEARVSLENFAMEGQGWKNQRHIISHLEKNGCAFEIIEPEKVSDFLPALKIISDEWLLGKKGKEKGFSLGFFSSDYLKNFPLGLVRENNRPVGFANILKGGGREEISVDLMRYTNDAPEGVMEYLFLKLMLWGAGEGFKWFNLGMAPLSGLENRALAPLWNKVGNFIFQHGENFFNFEGLRAFKEKFHPVWEPKYLAAPSTFRLPAIFANISSLISGGLKGIVSK